MTKTDSFSDQPEGTDPLSARSYYRREDGPSDLDLLQVIMRVEVSGGGWVRHACRHGGGLGQNPGAVYGLGEGGVGGGGGGGGWHVEFWVRAGVAHGDQVLLGAGVLALTLQRLTAHDQLTFWGDPCGDGNCLCRSQPQRLQIQTIYRYEGVGGASGQREALDGWYLARLRQEVGGSRCGTADPDAALAPVLQQLDVPRAIIQSLRRETRKCPISGLDLRDDLKDGWMVKFSLDGLSFPSAGVFLGLSPDTGFLKRHWLKPHFQMP